MQSDISDWSITFVDTGLESAIGERLRRVRGHLDGDEYFLANYADVLTDAPLDHIDRAVPSVRRRGFDDDRPAAVVVPLRRGQSETGEVKDIIAVSKLPIWENGGFFVLSQEIFDLLPPGGDLVEDVCGTLAGQGQAVRLSVRRILETRRHVQGTGRTRRQISRRRPPVDGVGTAGRRRLRGVMIQLFTGVLDEIAVVGAHCDDIAIGMGGTLLTLRKLSSGAAGAGARAVRWRHRPRSGGDGRAGGVLPWCRCRPDGARRAGRTGAGALGANQEPPQRLSQLVHTAGGVRSATR